MKILDLDLDLTLQETFFLFYFLADTCPFWGDWYPCFGFLVTSPLGFKARVGSALFALFCGGECTVQETLAQQL